MTIELRVKVTRRGGAPFAGARCSVDGFEAPQASRQAVADATGAASFTIDAPSPGPVRLTVSPPAARASLPGAAWDKNDTAFWPVIVEGDYDPDQGRIAWSTPPLEVVSTGEGDGVAEIEVRLLRVRNMDAVVQGVLSRYVVGGAPIAYPPAPAAPDEAPQPLPFWYTELPLLGADGRVGRAPVNAPAGDPRRASLLEVAAREGTDGKEEPRFAPKCVGIWVPDEVAVMDAPPLLFYFRPTADQDFDGRWSSFENLPGDKVTTHAYFLDRASGYDHAGYYFEWFFRRTFEYVMDPWARTGNVPYAAGLIDQIHASGKLLGVIAPVPEAGLPNGGFGASANDPAFVAELLAEILEHVELRSSGARGGAPPRPGRSLGRFAAAAFSSGNLILQTFAQAVLRGGTVGAALRELYFLDTPSAYATAIQEGARFLQSAGHPDAALRVYAQGDYVLGPPFADLHTALAPARGAPADLTWERAPEPRPGLPHRTGAYLPADAWPAEGALQGEIHSFIPATMICHALRLSGFPDRS
jgi:hypothetical protein